MSLSDSKGSKGKRGESEIVGDLLALFSAVMYACYVIYLKKKLKEEKVFMPMFFGFVGLFNVLLMFPILVILSLTNLESFNFPPNGKVWEYLSLNGMVGTFLSDYIWVLSVLLLSPVISTVGLSLTIPIALFADLLFGKSKSYTPTYILGSMLVLLGSLSSFQTFSPPNNTSSSKKRVHFCQHSFASSQALPAHTLQVFQEEKRFY